MSLPAVTYLALHAGIGHLSDVFFMSRIIEDSGTAVCSMILNVDHSPTISQVEKGNTDSCRSSVEEWAGLPFAFPYMVAPVTS